MIGYFRKMTEMEFVKLKIGDYFYIQDLDDCAVKVKVLSSMRLEFNEYDRPQYVRTTDLYVVPFQDALVRTDEEEEEDEEDE